MRIPLRIRVLFGVCATTLASCGLEGLVAQSTGGSDTSPVYDSISLDTLVVHAVASCYGSPGQATCLRQLTVVGARSGVNMLPSFPRSGISLTFDGHAVPIVSGTWMSCDLNVGCHGWNPTTTIPISWSSLADTTIHAVFAQYPSILRPLEVSFRFDTAQIPTLAIDTLPAGLLLRFANRGDTRVDSLRFISSLDMSDWLHPAPVRADSTLVPFHFRSHSFLRTPVDSSRLASEWFGFFTVIQGRAVVSIAGGDTSYGTFSWNGRFDGDALAKLGAYRRRFCTNCR